MDVLFLISIMSVDDLMKSCCSVEQQLYPYASTISGSRFVGAAYKQKMIAHTEKLGLLAYVEVIPQILPVG